MLKSSITALESTKPLRCADPHRAETPVPLGEPSDSQATPTHTPKPRGAAAALGSHCLLRFGDLLKSEFLTGRRRYGAPVLLKSADA